MATADDARYYNDHDGVVYQREVRSDVWPHREHDDRVGGPQFRNRKGRGPFRGRMYSEQPMRQRHRGGPGGGAPGPRARFEDDDGDVAMNDGGSQDGSSQRRFNPYGRQNRRGDGRFDRERKGGGGGGYRMGVGGGGGGGAGGGRKSWFKMTIPYGRKYEKKWLLTALQNLCSVPFTPIHYHTDGNRVHFYIDDGSTANALSKVSRKITDTEGYKVTVLMNTCSPPSFIQAELKPEDLDHLKQCMSKRFDGSQQALDLNSIRTDPDLVSQNIEVILNRKSCMQAVIKIIEENIPGLTCLNLSNNKLYKLEDLAELVSKVPNLKILNLSNNELKTERELDKVKAFKLVELWLDRNPLCDHFKDQATYISAVRERFPRLLKLDGHDLPPPIGFDVEAPTTLPPCKGSYFVSDDIKSLILRFLQQCSLGEYHKDSRNIKKLKDPTTRFRLLKHTRLNVVAFLNELPKTQHDTASFNVDVNTYTDMLLSFTVSGVFKEVDGKPRDSVRAFSRVFVAVPAGNAGLGIVNDELFVRNATTEEIRRAFAAPAPTPSSSPIPTLSASQQEMLSAFSAQSGMNLEWSQRCLQDNEWDFNRAADIFTQYKIDYRGSYLTEYPSLSPSPLFLPPGQRKNPRCCLHKVKKEVEDIKRACRYLLQHYLGHFLQERLSLEQLSLDLYNGSGVIRDINLDVWAVNELLESVGAPLEIVDGGSWDSQGWSSCMTSSMQLAQECLKDPPEASEEPPAPLEGLEMFAQTIETVLRRIKVTFLDTIVRIEHQPLDLDTSIALEVHIKRLDYCDEAVRDSSQTVPVDIHQPPAVLHKILQLSAVQLLYESTGVPQDGLGSETEGSPEAPVPPQRPLLIGSCSGVMETTVKIKQNDALPGPKLELDGKVGCLHLLLSPDQITHLMDLLSALCIDTEPSGRDRGHSRPLGSEDLRLIEEDLSKQLGSDLMDRDEGEEGEMEEDPFLSGLENGEMFYSMGAGMSSSVMSGRSGSELSDRRSSQRGQSEPLKPDALLRLSLGGVTLTLLEHEPPTSLPGSQGPPGVSSLAEMSRVFFQELAYFKDTMLSGRDFRHLRECFAKACPHSHLRMTGAAVQLSCEMRSGGHHAREVTSDMSFSRLELLECLWEPGPPEYTELLQFQNAGSFTLGAAPRPCAQLHYNLKERQRRKWLCAVAVRLCARLSDGSYVLLQSGAKQRVMRRDSVMRLELGELSTELDLDVLIRLDRLTQALSHGSPQTEGHGHSQVQHYELHSSLTMLSPHMLLKLRFPIPDLRPPPQCRPPGQRAVRDEMLSLEFSNLELSSQQGPDPLLEGGVAGHMTQLFEACFSDLQGIYEGWEGGSFPCIRVLKDPDAHSLDNMPRISVRVSDGGGGGDRRAGLMRDRDLGSMSLESPCELRERESSPFSSNRTMFETEEMVIPADPVEMHEFQAQCISQCQFVVDITLPLAVILLPSKEAYQSVYNRINNDLLMWEPPPEAPSGSQGPHSPSRRPARTQDDEFRLCKSAFRLDSDSEEEEAYQAASESTKRRGETRPGLNQGLLSLTIHVGRGRLQAMTDSKSETGRRVEHCHGEIMLDVEGGKIFSVSQHQGNPNLNFLCLESKKVELYHRAVVPDSAVPTRLEVPNFAPPDHLDLTIYPTEVGVSSVGGREVGAQMLSTAIKITLDLQRNVKEFLVALRLQGATLRHHMALTNHSWHEQLVDFLDVIDDPILGYSPPAVITVLHTHLATCAVDYRYVLQYCDTQPSQTVITHNNGLVVPVSWKL
ncbi:hypothetical protein JZ751_006793 [Albula glossodonta]|uniref:Nuclear RNA export factor 1 n=1 Tax=Albula glossodonta TaxID=121402 RepID=A0A8T2PA24_9TELE|nr:hypothetical protein JZ751_006793 [Albula glossodonta]